MENYLFLLELFVDTVTFSSNLPSYPQAPDVTISGGVGKDIKMDVFTLQAFPDSSESQKEMQMNCGRSTLFACTPEEFLSKINANPFEIVVYIKNKPIGSAPIYWTRDFFTLVKKSKETFGVSGPASMQDQFLLKEKESDRIMGDIKASVKLSAFGNNIQTSYQLLSSEQDAKRKFLIRGARGQTTFQCQKMNGHSDEVLPLTCLFSDQRSNDASKSPSSHEEEPLSWMALFKSTLDPKYSSLPEEFNVAISNVFTGKNTSALTFDIVSLMEKPEENKYIDLRIRGGSHGFIFEFDKPGDSSLNEIKLDLEEQGDDAESLTVEKINRMLCKNKDCPAAKKFKQFGIGPLANTKGLGAVYGEPSLPTTYGISQTYGVFDEYGPYGLFSRPKRPSQPFIPKEDKPDWRESCWKPKKSKKDKPCGCHKQDHSLCYCQNFDSPLRLTGGGVCDSPLRLKGGGMLDYDDVKSPFHECKEVMDQFDEVLRQYKKALGPCGQVTCPFAPNVTKESCKQRCQHDQDVYSVDDYFNMAEPTPPTVTKQPAKEKFKVKGACGSTKCAYAKYKRGLQDEDAEMELQYLPAAPSGKCGHPKCPYPVQPDLPPIHWDCPDPLPKGRCKNPDCPYLPKEIKCLNAVLAKGPCGNFNCPFSPPPPCDSPTCPFASKECPYAEKSETESVCDNPECPFAPKKENSLCDNPECPYRGKKEPPPSCSPPPPSCPPVNPCLQNLLAYYAMVTGNGDLLRVCYGGPECPYDNNKAKKKPSPCYIPDDPCANPKCPYVKQKPSPCYPPNDSCANPECPYVKKTPSPCHPPDDSCANPECPYMEKSPDMECDKTKQNDDFCGNNECPYAPKTCYTKPPPCYPPEEEGVCPGPPPCPFNLSILQSLLPFFPITICPEGTCPYGGTGLQDLLQMCMGAVECPKPCPPPPPQPCTMMEEKKDGDVCANPSCQYKKTDEKSKELNEGVEYTSETRVEIDNAPCTRETCQSQGGQLVCTECPCSGGGGGEFEGGGLEEGATEYRSDTRISVDMAPCTPGTCKSKGGKLVCDVCPCGGRKKGAEIAGGKKKKKKKRKRFVYTIGDKYPGVHIGHKECVLPAHNVPPRMGWLWNIFTPCLNLKPRRGWRPGAIAKIVAERIRKHREAQGLQMLELRDFRRGKKGGGAYESGTSINIQPKPTLHIKKHDGCYWITMNPLKDPHTLVENESPYMDCTPMQFKIVKNKKEGEEYKSCFCGEGEVGEESSSDSELEIEFTPPAGIIHPERFKRKRNVVHCDTQYLATDFEAKSEKSGKKGKKGKKDKKKKGKKGKKGKKKK
ncbi:uncharacterized protein LOC659255 [Tribolium castaneum]|uniref:DUF4776 domain-containing protein n=1 Tax=Tribolium castaneum TaxID=7070 RepID=D6WSZ6_TRICA|nr:PREDICTED: uncharacterized protein LOC659255 [Tribolium castaneum]EFA06328.1 hypothetical protein TcasGA2_TC009199 [Tribolium castaneum]|eukprot:XP_970673.1 PREDICTED: uncharacterized protein LOC659255 [Tribolium castaneum]